ncbi:retrotransposon ORF-1 protein [Arabidopsis thaliana]|nr:retrotransposon ORF-1 protein [Arabidopsis thaliana]AEE77916.1 retrotransposon ORF-1 protein [Arabidopsis thaliana]|eukprot:NP_190043.4 retrotransposon ORF-1 protein [Arabidopsis thaliana]
MGRYWEMDEDVYPKLVKEFIATCRLTYANPENPKASKGKLTFFLNKQHYSKTLFEICDMYGFTKGEAVEFPKSPVVRYVAKLLGSVLYFKPVITVVQEIELPLLFYGVKHLLDAYSDIPAPDTNVAAVLCDTLVKMKNNVPTSAAKSILAANGLDLPDSYQFHQAKKSTVPISRKGR